MGDHEDLPEPDGLMPNGLRPSEASTVSKILDAERWSLAEERTSELIKRIQPNKPSEDRRMAVANYVQGLIKKCFPCQVFTFGSVPLKTYLPDGDIDLTAFSKNLDLKDTWANEVREVLENEEKSLDAEFRVKEVQYIKAEVKIIKCLVENIVVDISFNQLGGLCTLCFLEEIDNLINQDHLFKRSIILIKAWCYYESRILGAHHGLLSTYALETLVLYIFHVFNNSFAGPLEVLYRFLEFFSKFDWENFCVSLWGPVQISSLPDTTAEPPRKDSGDLLLSRIFLDACSAVYAVFPSGHDTQGPPFVSKHFNVIDPLRTNNNLGRSVSKGNFYRIRSAFSFGAKRLAGLLECPKEDITAEVDKFFTNTWRRHGSGNRPDAAALVSLQPQESNSHSNDDLVSCRNQDNIRRKFDNVGLQPAQQLPSEGVTTSSVIENFSQQVSTANQFHPSIGRTGPSGSLSQKSYSSQGNYRTLDQVARNINSTETVRIERLKSHSKHVNSNDYTGQGKLQFARTHSSPELSDASEEILPHSKRTIMPDFAKNHFMSGKSNANFWRIRGQDARFVNDSMSRKYNSRHEDRATIVDSNCMPDDFHDDTSTSNTGEELASVSQSLDTHQEEQDSVNMMALPRMNGLVQPLQLPINFTTHQFPVPSHFFPPINYSPKNIGVIPATVPISLWPPQFPQGFAAPSLSSYLSTHQLETNGEEAIESVNDASSLTEINQDDASDHAFWPEQENVSSLGFIPRDSSYQVFNSNETKEPFGGLSFIPFPHVGTPNVLLMRDDARVSTEGLNMERTSHDEQILHQNNKENDVYSSNKSADTRSLHSSRGSSSRSTIADTWDGSSAKATKLPRDRWGRKPVASATSATSYGNSRSWRNYEDRDDHSSEWSKQSSSGSEIAEQTDSLSTASGSHQSSCPDPALASGSDSVFPVAPMFVFASHRQRSGSGTGSVFYPTGPPVPYYMLPTLPSGSGSSDGVLDQVNRLDINQLNPLARDLDSSEKSSSEKSLQIEESTSTTTMDAIPSGSSVERKSDILNGDFPSHWLNLQYGRLCQDPNVPGPPVYPAPVIVPSMHFQGHYSCDAHGRPFVANANPFPIMNCGPRILLPLQPGSVRHGELFQHYGDEVPSFRGGTGTFLPKQKAPLRDRQPNTRNHRTNYNHDHNGQGDREGSWINAKSRAANRSHGRAQHDRPNTRPDRLPAIDNRAERSWESHKNERVSNYQNSSSSTSASHGLSNMTYGMYPLTSINSDNPSGSSFPSFVMLYPYHHPGVGYASASEQDELGSFSSVQIPGANEARPSCNGGVMRNAFEPVHETYQQGSDCSSPDQPSSPHIRR